MTFKNKLKMQYLFLFIQQKVETIFFKIRLNK